MPKESMLKPMLSRTNLHSNGESSTLMERMPQEQRVLTPTEVSISTDHSTFNPDCGSKESSLSQEAATLLFKPELTMIRNRFGPSIKDQRLLSLSKIRRGPSMLELEMPTHNQLTLDGTNCSNMKVPDTLSMNKDYCLESKVRLMPKTDKLSERLN